MDKSKFEQANEEIAEKVTTGFQKMSGGAAEGFSMMTETVVGGYQKIEDAFVDQFLKHDGETLEEAKGRLHQAQADRKAQHDESVQLRKDAQAQRQAEIKARHQK